MSFVTAEVCNSRHVQATILVNIGNTRIGPKVKVSVKFLGTLPIVIKKILRSTILLFLQLFLYVSLVFISSKRNTEVTVYIEELLKKTASYRNSYSLLFGTCSNNNNQQDIIEPSNIYDKGSIRIL